MAFTANLVSAHPSRGPVLLTPDLAESLELEIDSLKALGVRESRSRSASRCFNGHFTATTRNYRHYLTFNVHRAEAIHARSLTLVVTTQTIFPFSDGFTPWDVASYYDSLTLEEYREGQMKVARTLAAAL